MTNFITHTSINYSSEAVDGLLKLGYKPYLSFFNPLSNYHHPILTNALAGLLDIGFDTIEEENKTKYNRYYCGNNVELFLALSAMTDNPTGIKGEWWKFIGENDEWFSTNKLYIQNTNHPHLCDFLINNQGGSDGFCKLEEKQFVKATKEEIIIHFTAETNNPCAEINLTTNNRTMWKKYTLKKDHSSTKHVAAAKILLDNIFDFSKDYFVENSTTHEKAVEWRIMDWFEEIKDEVIVEMGPILTGFKLTVKDNKVYHKTEDITSFVTTLIEKFDNCDSICKYSVVINEITFERTGCEKCITKLSDWRKVYNLIVTDK